MPRDQEFPMNSVVYVILEEKAKVRSETCAATLRDVHQTSTKFKFYEVQLLQKCAMHQEGQQVSVDESNIFRSWDECNAVWLDRSKRSLAPDEHLDQNSDALQQLQDRMNQGIARYKLEIERLVAERAHEEEKIEGKAASSAKSVHSQAEKTAVPALPQPAKAGAETEDTAEPAAVAVQPPPDKTVAQRTDRVEHAQKDPEYPPLQPSSSPSTSPVRAKTGASVGGKGQSSNASRQGRASKQQNSARSTTSVINAFGSQNAYMV